MNLRLWRKSTHHILGAAVALCCSLALAAPALAEGPSPAPVAKDVKIVKSYPAGRALPILIAVTAPQGYQLKGPLRLETTAGGGLAAIDHTIKPADSAKGFGKMVALHPLLKVGAEAKAGRRVIRGRLHYVLADAQGKEYAGSIAWQGEVTVGAVGSRPQFLVPPNMLAAMGVEIAQPPVPKSTASRSGGGDPFAGRSLGWILLLVFVGGLGLNLTPCVYPMIPITVSFFGGRAEGSRGALAANAVVYLLGMCLTYSILGSVVALGGGMLGQALSHPVVLLAIAGVMVAMAASMFGLWEMRLPAALNRVGSANRSGLLGTLVMGLTVGIIVAPCVGPFVVGLMAHVGKVGQWWYGLLVFLALSLGLGLPLAVLAVFSGSISRLPGAGGWMIWVRKFFGVILVLMAIYIIEPLLGLKVFFWTLAALALAGGVYLALTENSGTRGFLVVKRIVSLMLVTVVGVFLWVGVAPRLGWTLDKGGSAGGKIAWQQYTPDVMDRALKAGKPVLVFFTADWCAPCKRLKAITLKDPKVIKTISSGFTPIWVDFTSNPSPAARALSRRFGVRGVPTNVILDAKGNWLSQLTMIGFRDPEYFRSRLEAALAHGRK